MRGLRLVARDKAEDLYEVAGGRQRARGFAFAPEVFDPAIGFDDVLVEKPFEIRAEYILPESLQIRGRQGYAIGFSQRWRGEEVGAARLVVQPVKGDQADVDQAEPKYEDNGKMDKPIRRK